MTRAEQLRTAPALLLAALPPDRVTAMTCDLYRQGDADEKRAVLKCVFMGVPLNAVDRLDERADTEPAAMLAAFADERAAAGRPMPEDAAALLHRLTRQET
ncbi:EboA domain-containing protein [Nonomuraea sp. NPDC052116]|uniref:EboA domain-containing protein n=1 Tax=Nonomuraea sp. NPDC052116 TaxID=3155665 RepID=UPI00342206CA